jgi:hypothetical protein
MARMMPRGARFSKIGLSMTLRSINARFDSTNDEELLGAKKSFSLSTGCGLQNGDWGGMDNFYGSENVSENNFTVWFVRLN